MCRFDMQDRMHAMRHHWSLHMLFFLRDVTLHVLEKQADICVGRDQHGKKILLRPARLEEEEVEEDEEENVAREWC